MKKNLIMGIVGLLIVYSINSAYASSPGAVKRFTPVLPPLYGPEVPITGIPAPEIEDD